MHHKSLDDYLADALLRAGVERLLTIIGEALQQALKVDPSLAPKITDARKIVNFRNGLVHGYAAVEHETVWGVLENDVPSLEREIHALLPPPEGSWSLQLPLTALPTVRFSDVGRTACSRIEAARGGIWCRWALLRVRLEALALGSDTRLGSAVRPVNMKRVTR